MPYSCVTTNNARTDILKAIEWENSRQQLLGDYFFDDLENRLNDLCVTPTAGSIRYDNVRVTYTRIFPYNIHYIVDDEKQEIIVLRVLSRYREPLY
jgi:plasmid stabilization system protein ParE